VLALNAAEIMTNDSQPPASLMPVANPQDEAEAEELMAQRSPRCAHPK